MLHADQEVKEPYKIRKKKTKAEQKETQKKNETKTRIKFKRKRKLFFCPAQAKKQVFWPKK